MYTWEQQVELFENVKHIKYETFREYATIYYKSIIDRFKDGGRIAEMLLNDYEDCLLVFEYLSNGDLNNSIRRYSSLDTVSRDKVFEVLLIVYNGL